jgi:RecJ-like exonuclease|tara:strand:+ start:127 stop:270 length:144 start_codon:yes stop_codon:yes gene_type:complete
VGSITQVQSKSTNTVYTIDDGTGQIDVMFWTTGEESEQQLKKKELWA